jgi:hypothetical protein
MKCHTVAVLTLFTSFGVGAQSIKAEDLERLCTSTAEAERQSCSLIVKIYMDGFLEGVAKGVLDTYKYDADVLALVKDVKIKDAVPRVNKVVAAATCIQRVSVVDMTETYVDYVRRNPASKPGNYRNAMTRAIVAKYCDK